MKQSSFILFSSHLIMTAIYILLKNETDWQLDVLYFGTDGTVFCFLCFLMPLTEIESQVRIGHGIFIASRTFCYLIQDINFYYGTLNDFIILVISICSLMFLAFVYKKYYFYGNVKN